MHCMQHACTEKLAIHLLSSPLWLSFKPQPVPLKTLCVLLCKRAAVGQQQDLLVPEGAVNGLDHLLGLACAAGRGVQQLVQGLS